MHPLLEFAKIPGSILVADQENGRSLRFEVPKRFRDSLAPLLYIVAVIIRVGETDNPVFNSAVRDSIGR